MDPWRSLNPCLDLCTVLKMGGKSLIGKLGQTILAFHALVYKDVVMLS